MVKRCKLYFFFIVLGLISFWQGKSLKAWPDLPDVNGGDCPLVSGDKTMDLQYYS